MIHTLNSTHTPQAHPALESESFAGEWQSLQLRRTELIAQHRELIEARDVYAEVYDSASEPLLTLARCVSTPPLLKEAHYRSSSTTTAVAS